MNKAKLVGAGALLVLGFWCLGRVVEMALNRNPNVLEKRETITAGLLLGVPSSAGGAWLLWDRRRQLAVARQRRIREAFFKLVQTEHGKVTPLQLAMASHIDGQEAKDYLSDRSIEYDATFEVDVSGHIIYCFPLSGNLTSDRESV